MEKMGFNDIWRKLIMGYVTSMNFAVILNGVTRKLIMGYATSMNFSILISFGGLGFIQNVTWGYGKEAMG